MILNCRCRQSATGRTIHVRMIPLFAANCTEKNVGLRPDERPVLLKTSPPMLAAPQEKLSSIKLTLGLRDKIGSLQK
jgi:hypothetical protein